MARIKHAILSLAFIAGICFGALAHALSLGGTVNVQDPGEPTLFDFSFGTPAFVLVGLVSWSADVSGSLLDVSGDGISATPVGASLFEFLIGGSIVGVDTLGTVTSAFADSYSGVFDCGVSCTSIGLRIHFTGSGNGDIYSMSSALEVLPATQNIPEPGMLALLAIGLAGLGFSRRSPRT